VLRLIGICGVGGVIIVVWFNRKMRPWFEDYTPVHFDFPSIPNDVNEASFHPLE
jgi:hypothetical protein